MIWRLSLILLLPLGCSSFNKPFSADALYAVSQLSSTKIYFYRFPTGSNTLVEAATFDVGSGVVGLSGAKGILAYSRGGNVIGTITAVGNVLTKQTERSVAAVSSVGVTDDRLSLYYGYGDGFSVRRLVSGVIAAADAQTFSILASSDEYNFFMPSGSGTTLLAGINASTHGFSTQPMVRDSTTGLLSGAGSQICVGGEYTLAIANFSSLGTDILWSFGSVGHCAYRANGGSTTVLSSTFAFPATAAAAHPSQPWVYLADAFTNNVSRYVVSTSSMTLAAGSTLAVGSGTSPYLTIDPSGSRLLAYFPSTGLVKVYTISSTGALTFAASQTLVASAINGPLIRVDASRD